MSDDKPTTPEPLALLPQPTPKAPAPADKPGESPQGQQPFGTGAHGPQAAGGPAGAEHNPDPPRPKQVDGFFVPDNQRGSKDG